MSDTLYEAAFSVSCDTDMNAVPDIIEMAVSALPFVLPLLDGLEVALQAFGENAVDFSVEFRVSGVDGGKNKYMSPVMFAIWNALEEAGIEMPYPQRVVYVKAVRND